MPGKTTTGQETIRRRAERRGAVPTTVEELSGAAGTWESLRFDSKSKDTTVEPVNWDGFFDKFEESDLAFLYQEKNGGRKGKPVPYLR